MWAHRNHTERLLIRVDIFNHAVACRRACIARAHVCQQIIPSDFTCVNSLDYITGDEELVCILIDEQQRPHHPSCIITYPNFGVWIVKDNRCVYIDNTAPFLQLEFMIQTLRIASNPNPCSIHEDLDLAICIARFQRLEAFNMFVNIRMQRCRVAMNRHVTEITDILDNTDTSTFWCFRGAKKPPGRIM